MKLKPLPELISVRALGFDLAVSQAQAPVQSEIEKFIVFPGPEILRPRSPEDRLLPRCCLRTSKPPSNL